MSASLQHLGLWVMLGLVLGGLGSALIAHARLGFVRSAAWFLLLSATPYAVALGTIAMLLDPSLEPRQAQYNGEMAFALFVLGFTIPWIVACLVGAFIGSRIGRARVARRAGNRAAPPVPPANGRPDWRHADSPMLSLPELAERLGQIADRHGFARNRLPGVGPPRDGEGSFIDRDKFDYLYGYSERGTLTTNYAAAVCDELSYRVFHDLAYGDAMAARAAAPRDDVPYLVQVRQNLDEILDRIDPRWAAQARYERTVREASAG